MRSLLLKIRYFPVKRWSHSYSKCVKKVDITKILVANRGEIACRIMRTAKKMGIKTVAVYSEADKNSIHTAMADEAYCIGPPSSDESYLRADKILSVAKKTNAVAIHPGYGFLSENAEFAEICNSSDIVFIGPPASAIRDMGIKSTSKKLMESAGVPVIKGYHKEDQSEATLTVAAKNIGFPIMIKAVRGGGGKGMRIAMNPNEFMEQVESARREAKKSFNDDALLLEQLILRPRHIEVQVFGDLHGNYVYLFERDCSVQRRHQKIIEEAPAPGISEELRKELGEAAVQAARAVGYLGAGTVEFIFDIDTNNFYFMEMNTRLQVEHPITEMITNTDLVEWQILVASGEKLPVTQGDLFVNGHSVEARIYAEDPYNNFLPDAGKLLHFNVPKTTSDVRIETGVGENDDVSVYYDPMIAKLVVWAEDRKKAFDKLYRQLVDFHVAGLSTNISFLLRLINHPDMRAGSVHTAFIPEHHDALFGAEATETPSHILVQVAVAIALLDKHLLVETSKQQSKPYNPFVSLSGFRVNHKFKQDVSFVNNRNSIKHNVKIIHNGISEFVVILEDGKEVTVSGTLSENERGLTLKCNYDESTKNCEIFRHKDNLYMFDTNNVYKFTIDDPRSIDLSNSEVSVSNRAVSPMPGTVDKVFVQNGDKVKLGDPLVVIMAMKMEHIIKSPNDGVIENVLCAPGENVDKDACLVILG